MCWVSQTEFTELNEEIMKIQQATTNLYNKLDIIFEYKTFKTHKVISPPTPQNNHFNIHQSIIVVASFNRVK